MKEKIKIIILLLVLFGIGTGFMIFWYLPHREDIKKCKIFCEYRPDNSYWIFKPVDELGGRIGGSEFGKLFSSQKECIDFCLNY